jgi:molybdopterin converting factor small subunit
MNLIAVERIPDMGAPMTAQAAGEMTVTVRYWASIKAAAGRAEDVVDSVPDQSVADLLTVVRALHADNPRFEQVLSVCSLLLDERPVGSTDPAAVPVRSGALLDVLPPFAGG